VFLSDCLNLEFVDKREYITREMFEIFMKFKITVASVVVEAKVAYVLF